MAKYNEREGSSCHIHLSLRGARRPDRSSGDDAGRTPLYDAFVAGLLATMRDFTLLYAPNINSYKRFAGGSFAPTAIGWGVDNRTCAVRLVGTGECAGWRTGCPAGTSIRTWRWPPCSPAVCTGSSSSSSCGRRRPATPTLPSGRGSPTHAPRGAGGLSLLRVARSLFGDEVVDHYTTMADVELAAFDAHGHRLGAAARLREDVAR